MMFLSLDRATPVLAGLGLLYLSACSPQPHAAAAGTPEFYWSAAGESWSAGAYGRTADHLEHLLEPGNAYATRAVPWYLVVTSGMARGYTELADRYDRGALINKAKAPALRREAAKYRTMAGKLSLRFAQVTERFRDIPVGYVPLAFAFPAGNPGEPPLFTRIGSGIELSAAEQEKAEAVALQRGVLMTVCLAAGAPNDIAKGREVLGAGKGTTRESFGKAVAESLTAESALFTRDKLDDPQKIEAFQKRAEMALAEGARIGSARIGLLVSDSAHKD
jgi:hypothetical protein